MKNWKTTLFGLILTAGAFLAQNTTGTSQTIGKAITLIGTAGIGFSAKDHDVTGGTKQQ